MNLQDALVSNFESFESTINGAAQRPEHKIRRRALEAFKSSGLPGPKNEEYKYTPLTKVLEKSFDFSTRPAKPAISSDQANKYMIPGLEANNLVFVNGKYKPELSTIVSPKEEIVIKDLQTAFAEDSDQIEKHFSQQANFEKDGFVAVNTAFTYHGCYIHVPKNTKVKKPVAMYFINDATQGQVFNNPRNLFLIDESSEVTFIEDFNTEGNHESLTNIVTEIVVADNADVQYYKLQNNKKTAFHVGTTQVKQARSSRFSAFTFTLSGAIIRNNMNIVVEGEGCESNMYGLYLLNGKTHVDNHTEVDHQKPHCESNELYKGIMDDHSHGVFNGKVFVRQEAQKTNAFQSNKNILLSDNAVINSKPQLEIWADDVKCSHGCTTGQLDEEGIFYLRSRGISKESARALMLYAFAMDVLTSVKLDALKEFLKELIADRLQRDF